MEQKQNMQEGVGKIVAAAMKVLYSPEMEPHLEQGLQDDAPIAQRLAMQVAGLIKMVDEKEKMSLSKRFLIPAAVILVQDLAKFATEAMGIEVSEEELIQAQQMVAKGLLAEYAGMQQQQQGGGQPEQAEAPPEPQQPPAPTGLIAGAR